LLQGAPVSQSNPVGAAIWMLGAAASFSAMAVAGRELSVEMNTFELMLYRSLIGIAIVMVLLKHSSKGLGQIKTTHIEAHFKRNIVHFTAQNMWFYGVTVIALSQLVALEFTNPIWVALLAPLLLNETMTKWRIIAAIVGFIGILIVARPGAEPISWGHAAGLGAAIGFALNTIFTKGIMRYDSVLCVLFYMTVMQAVMALICAIPGGIPLPSSDAMPWIVVVGVCGLTAHYCLTSALGAAPATVVAPLEFVRLPIIAIVGVLLYDEPLLASIFIGAAIILAANLLNIVMSEREKTAAD
jgi:drug/metabolite transporter (DMT)-like permease